MKLHKGILLLAIVVAVLLPMSVLASGPYHQPYEDPDLAVEYAVAHESTEAFNQTLQETHLSEDNPTQVAGLSSETQRAFNEMKAQPVESDSLSGSGWQYGDITVCVELMLACDEYTEQPDFPTTAKITLDTVHSAFFTVVEHDDELYVVKQIHSLAPAMHIGPSIDAFVTAALFAAYGLFIGGFTYFRGESHPLLSLGFIGYGMSFIIWPYLIVYTNIDGSPIKPVAGGLVIGIAYLAISRGFDR
ncbi:hypothetical protein [Natrarchaeobaculum sulfurireducens]|uniref:Uncharacterized protein n=1 Tax=Natrarchaeobaculum sulfurireducens TaxID=2044521 RepID=A0A346P9P4_9EURY|nr:hypothetical protein [Natrarchaeobaculum sulfurireducens]AXR76239.1 hypothetical protein AArc1_5038 [Natrarchaeobaculum sulfurireducens]